MFRLILAIAILGFVYADEPESIVGATNARDGEFPYTVSIRVNGRHFCGGCIISNKHILTAAHCVVPLVTNPSRQVTVVTGTNYLSYGGQHHRVERYFYHPQYDQSIKSTGINWYYDIGVIKLAAPIQFNAKQQPVQLPSSPPAANQVAVISGWGLTAPPPNGRPSPTLQHLPLNIIPYDVCQQSFNRLNFGITINDIMLCTFNRVNQGTCNGDSGGPLVVKNVVAGVVSGGIPCARGVPDIFTNVYKFLPLVKQWIAS